MLRSFSSRPSARVINGRRVFTAELTCFARACSCVCSASWHHIQNPPQTLVRQFLVPDPGLVLSTTLETPKILLRCLQRLTISTFSGWFQNRNADWNCLPPSIILDFHVLYSLVVIRAEMFPVKVSSGSAVSVNPAEMIYQPLSWNMEQLLPPVLMETAPMIPKIMGKS